MQEQILLRCLSDQKEEIQSSDTEGLVQRNECSQIDLDSKLAQVVTGVRRSGKSTLCQMALKDKGLKFGYVNFDDDRLAAMSVEDFDTLLMCIYRLYGSDVKYLFFDEIQNVDGWHLFVNRLLRQNHRILITGSNAKLLSSELTTHLTGRYNEIKLYPFSFKEYCRQHKINVGGMSTRNIAERKAALDSYLINGGFPELIEIKNKTGYMAALINTIINKDIRMRYHIRNAEGIKTPANHLINNVAQFIDVEELSNRMGIGSDRTVRNYIDYLAQAYLILPLSKFSFKSRERLRNKKAYVVDNGMVTYHGQALSPDNLGWRLENTVHVELLRRAAPTYHEIYYYKPSSRGREVDFVVTSQGKVLELIQVSYDITNNKTFNREINALIEASRKTFCDNLTLITMDHSEVIEREGATINIRAAHEWLCSE